MLTALGLLIMGEIAGLVSALLFGRRIVRFVWIERPRWF